ncbi:AadS family aminoglycoside 6-adenylyltransferase [Chitinophaga lutea]
MDHRTQTLAAVVDWAKVNDGIRAVLLTSSLANPAAPVDEFSDLDIELVFANQPDYRDDAAWVALFGKPISMVEEDESAFDGKHAMKMVLYEDHVKIDFKLWDKDAFSREVMADTLDEDWDVGYKVLLDKDDLTPHMKPPTFASVIIQRPAKEKFRQVLNDFWWDTTYVAKCLARDELFYAKFMSENMMRTDYLVPLIEWYIASENQWQITTNKQGRLFKKYLPANLWRRIEATFSGSDIGENWEALFVYCDVVHELGTILAKRLEYEYPFVLEKDIRKYLGEVRARLT